MACSLLTDTYEMALIKTNVYVMRRPAVSNVTMTVDISSFTLVFFCSSLAQCIVFMWHFSLHV